MKYPAIIGAVAALWFSVSAHADALDANTLITRSYELPRVDDQIATLTYTFSTPGKDEQQVVYTMVWKNMKGAAGYDNKAMFFTESPPDRRGIIYLGWLRTPGSAELDDEWIYLPELRMTRRIAHRDHAHTHDDDEFGNSLLKREHLDPRPPQLDDHVLLGTELLDGRMHYLVASTPKHHHDHGDDHMAHEAAAKTVRWIDQESYRIDRVQFYDAKDKETLDMRILWKQIDDFWVWRNVTATDPRTQARTVMEIDKIRINTALKEKDFSRRTLDKWPGDFH